MTMVANAVLIARENAPALAKLTHRGHKALRQNFVQDHRIHTGRKLKATTNPIIFQIKEVVL